MFRELFKLCNAAKCLTIVFLIVINNLSLIDGICALTTARAIDIDTDIDTAKATAPAANILSDTHRRSKRMNLEICLGQFDVHKNTIIRTGDSQSLGGKYLQGLELDTLDECQRLCCETENCDVYIFEAKNVGYCYLFECGPPENFHCKFTRHANYTSAVLTQVRHPVEVTTTTPKPSQARSGADGSGKISQQEWELTNLKVLPDMREKSGTPTFGGTMSASGPVVNSNGGGAAASLPFGVAVPAKTTNVSHCGRFQFTCHSGECIAVYNACDGIPQCEDGSDEGPECSGATVSSSVTSAKPMPDVVNVNLIEPSGQKIAGGPQYQTPVVQQSPQQQLQTVQQQQQQQQQQTSSHPAIAPALINNREDPATWANRKIVAAEQAEASNGADQNSRIFSHKGGLQLTANDGLNYIGGGNGQNLNPMYMSTLQRSGVYLPNGVYTPQQQQQAQLQQQQQQQQQQQPYMTTQGHLLAPPNVNWQQRQQQQPPVQSAPTSESAVGGVQHLPAVGPAYLINSQPQQSPAAPMQTKPMAPMIIQQQQQQQQEQHVQLPSVGQQVPRVPQLPDVKVPSASQANQKLDVGSQQLTPSEAHAASADDEEYDDSDENSTATEAPPRKKQRKHKKYKSQPKEQPKEMPKPVDDPIELALQQEKQRAPAPSPVHEQYKMIHDKLVMEFRDHDGLSDRPGGAMLSLTLGVLITAALAILIGCRMRTVGRRARRLGGKTPYSHEADFLVNGMYL